MILKKNQYVLFENGTKEGFLECRWSEKNQAFYTFDENGNKIFSTTILEKSPRKNSKFTPTKENCTVLIHPVGTTDKSYQLYDGSNGLVGRGQRSYYKYIAKSICYVDENGNIYAPVWAL